MSKRKRTGDVLVTRSCPVPRAPTPDLLTAILTPSSSTSSSSASFQPLNSGSRKRSYEVTCDNSYEISRKRPWPHQPKVNRGQKRTAEFDFEIERLQKRLKATTPSAEEAISFLLPHLLQMRRLYLNEHQKVSVLEQESIHQKNNNMILTRALRDQLSQKNLVQRQLDLALYRLSLIRNGSSF